MEFFLSDPHIVRLPPADTRLVDLQAEPLPDGNRLRVSLKMTPFQQKPYIDINLLDSSGVIAATASIIEPVAHNLDLTLHIRRPRTDGWGQYTLSASLYYPDLGEVDHRLLSLEIAAPTQ